VELPRTGDVLLEKYRLEKLLGEGGMGVVYAAHHELLGQRVAVKLIRPEYATQEDAVTRFLNEARAAARIENDHVARVLDVGILQGRLPYMVLEYLDGSDLAHVLHAGGRLPVADVADYLLQAIEAVAHAHAQGIIHRDLKPSNLFLARRPDGTRRLKVLDFGISKALGATPGIAANVTRTNAMLGSPLYMSPEQLRDSKGVDQRCDIWAFGVIAYELLTGQPPFNGENAVALFAAIMESTPPTLASLRPDAAALDPIVLRCLRNRPADRFSSVTELGVALAPFGTAISTRALDNAKRILPLSPTSTPSIGASSAVPSYAATMPLSSPAVPSSSASSPAVASHATPSNPMQPVGASTADPWASSQANLPSPPSSRGTLIALAALGVVSVLVGGIGIAKWASARSAHANAVAASASAPISSIASSSGTPPDPSPATSVSASTGSEASAIASASASASPSGSASAPASASASTPGKPVPVGAAPMAGKPTHVGPLVVAPKPSSGPAPAPATSKTVSCTPPYDFDANGKKIWKRECL
jgi:eukaryotic-like serine/threonine-protein kinase